MQPWTRSISDRNQRGHQDDIIYVTHDIHKLAHLAFTHMHAYVIQLALFRAFQWAVTSSTTTALLLQPIVTVYYELLCDLIGSSTSRLSLHILLVVKKQNG